MSGAFEAAKRAADETQQLVDDSRRQVRDAVDAIAGGPADDVEHAQQQIADLRSRLERDVAALRGRLPDRDELTARGRVAGIAAAGGVAGLGVAAVALKRRAARRSRDAGIREQARAIARELARIDLEDDVHAGEGGTGRGGPRLALLALLAAGAGVAVWARMRAGKDGPSDGVAGVGGSAVPDLEAGVREVLAATPDTEGGMVDLEGVEDR